MTSTVDAQPVLIVVAGPNAPTINAARITVRVIEGGHDVPIAKIISRFDKSLRNLRRTIPQVDRAYVYDNSVENVLPALQFRTVCGKVRRVYSTDHRWADALRTLAPHYRRPGSFPRD